MQHKIIVAIVFGVFLLFPSHQAAASILWCDPLLGGCSNPYSGVDQSMQQQQSQTQALQQSWQQIQNKESALKSQYGYAAYTSCTANMLNIDGGNLAQVTIYLNADEPCMAGYKAKQDAKTQCSTGYVYFNGSCVSGAQGCLNSWGANSVWTGTGCDCAMNYKWDGSKCVSTAPTCTANSTYNGSQCICNAGYSSLSGYCISNQAALGALHPTTVTTPTKTTGSKLAANQVAAILSLLQAFGADAKVIASVKAALGQ